MKHLVFFALVLAGCASRPITPDGDAVKVSREAPSGTCREIGRITGTSSSRKPSNEELLADLRKDTALKGGNYVKVEEYSSLGSSVTGTAFECP